MTTKQQMDSVMDQIIAYFNNDRPIPYELIIEHKQHHDRWIREDDQDVQYNFEQLIQERRNHLDHLVPYCSKCNDTTLIETKIAGIFRRCLCVLDRKKGFFNS